MTLASLPKEQKQYLVLGLFVAIALVALSIFGIKISLSSIAEARQELTEVSDKIESADRALAKGASISDQYVETSAELKALLQNIPPSRNYYSWATEIIYSQARTTELEIDAIDELSFARTEPDKKDKVKDAEGGVRLETYTLRITAHGGYRNVKEFLALIEEAHPMARIIGMEISSGNRPEIHDIQLMIQWPFNTDAIAKIWEAVAARNLAVEALPQSPRGADSESHPVEELEPEVTQPEPVVPPKQIPVDAKPAPTKPSLQEEAPLENKKPASRPLEGVLKSMKSSGSETPVAPTVQTESARPAETTESGKSANKLELLLQGNTKKKQASLGSVLESLTEETHENP